jgi:glucokinase
MRTAIGVDLGGTNTKTAFIDESGRVIKKKVFSTPAPFDRGAWSATLKEYAEALKTSERAPCGIGIGIAGLVDPNSRRVLHAPNIQGIDGWAIGEDLEKAFGLPVKADNDVNVMALGGHFFGPNDGSKNIVCLTLGTGVGGALIINGQLYRGSGFTAGELGHITINEEGPQCSCGNHGCAEAYLGNQRIVRRFKDFLRKDGNSIVTDMAGPDGAVTPHMIYEAAKKGDAIALKVWEETAAHLATLLSGVINLVNPDKIILGGGVANAFDVMEKPLWDNIHKRALKAAVSGLRIVTSKQGEDAGVIGAAALVLKEGAA